MQRIGWSGVWQNRNWMSKSDRRLVIVCSLFLDNHWARCLITSPRVVKILGVLPFHAHRSLAMSVTLYYNEELRLSGATKFIWRVLLLNPVCECWTDWHYSYVTYAGTGALQEKSGNKRGANGEHGEHEEPLSQWSRDQRLKASKFGVVHINEWRLWPFCAHHISIPF